MTEKIKSKGKSTLEKAEGTLEKLAGEVKEVVHKVEEVVEKTEGAIEEKAFKGKSKSAKPADDKKAKLAKLLEKAKKLEGIVEEEVQVDLKKKVREETAEKENTLVPMEDYLKASIHLGTRVITPDMRKYVYRRRADGLAVFNTAMLDDKIREGIAFLNKFTNDRIIFVCKRESGWKAAKKFSELTRIRTFTKKYPSGILTNTNLENFTECDLMFICDPWLDKNALTDAIRVKVPVVSICDTNNFTQGIDQVIPSNNKSSKSIGMILFLLAKYYLEAHKIPGEAKIQDFIDDWNNLVPPR